MNLNLIGLITIRKDISNTTVVLIELPSIESTFLTPFFAQIVVNPEKRAASNAKTIHILFTNNIMFNLL